MVARRCSARLVLRSALRAPPRKRLAVRIAKALSTLRGHHSWHRNNYAALQVHRPAMTWACKDCPVQNPDTSETCKGCQRHWSKVWHRGKSRRPSRPRQQPPKHRKEKEDTQNQKPEVPATKHVTQGPWQLFADKMPWVPSTPQTRVTSIRDKEEEDDKPLPPPPVLPAPPIAATGSSPLGQVEPLTEEEGLMLKHLKGLQGLNALPDLLAQQLHQLEVRQQATMEIKSLNHGHLNRLHRARNQVTSLTKRISGLDMEWKQFIATAMERMQWHSTHYHNHRSDLMESLNRKLLELEQVKKEVQEASQSLMGQIVGVDDAIEHPPAQEDLTKFHDLAHMLHQASDASIQLLDNDMEEELKPASPVSDKENPPKKHVIAPAPFRSPGSPGKVATSHLKPNKDRPKEK
eukprot:Skav229823  [mRNA]  locus=scaffold2672:85924:87229:- [translate_table: standard]